MPVGALDPRTLWRIAYNVCFNVRAPKASDADVECRQFADCVAQGGQPAECCNQYVRDPWGTNIFLGWFGQLFAPNAMGSPDCPTIAMYTMNTVNSVLMGVPVDEAVRTNVGMAQVMETMMEMPVLMAIMNMMTRMLRPDNTSKLLKPIEDLIPLLILLQFL